MNFQTNEIVKRKDDTRENTKEYVVMWYEEEKDKKLLLKELDSDFVWEVNEDDYELVEKKGETMDFKVGDRVRRINGEYLGMKKGDEDIIVKLGDESYNPNDIELHGFGTGHDKRMFCLVERGKKDMNASYEAIKERIESLSGSSSIKEVDDILNGMCVSSILFRLRIDCYDKGSVIAIERTEPPGRWSLCWDKLYNSQCEKLQVLKDALLYILDQSGIEKEETYGVGDVISVKHGNDTNATSDAILTYVGAHKFCAICLKTGNRYRDPVDLGKDTGTATRFSKSEVLKLVGGNDFTLVHKEK